LTDDILTELQGISLNDVTGLEHFGIVSGNFSGGDGCEDRKKTYREVEGVEKREFGELRLCTVCFVLSEDKV
jgi:hypothetical protein